MSSGRRISIALVGLVLLAAIGWVIKGSSGGSSSPPHPGTSTATSVPGSASGLPMRPLSALPVQAAQTYRLILAGGPFPYPTHDGVVFANREKQLPAESSGYYHEYTVPTPGSPDRGNRWLFNVSEN